MKMKQGVYKTPSESGNEPNLSEMNIFEQEKFKEQHMTVSGNGSNKLTTTGNKFVDDFINSKLYKEPREIEEIFKDCQELWSVEPIHFMYQLGILRTITRSTKTPDGVDHGKHTGQGLKFEYFGRLYWLGIYHKPTFYHKANLDILVSLGSWDDLFEVLRMDIMYEHEGGRRVLLNWDNLINYILDGLRNENVTNLIKKYLPTIKVVKDCKTLRNQANNFIAKKIANALFPNEENTAAKYKAYRQLKSSGTAHQFQQLISQERYSELNFNTIPGRVLGKMVKPRNMVTKNGKKVKSDGSTFVQRHGIADAYEKWLDKQPVAKFTGFVYELFAQIIITAGYSEYVQTPNLLQKKTINKQFMGLIETAKQNANCDTDLIVCVDSSASMTSRGIGTSVSAFTVARSMALFFSYFLKGRFNNTCLDFNHRTEIVSWTGETPVDKFINTRFSGCCSNTNVLSIAQLFVSMLEEGCKESDFPKGVLVISDGEFDRNYGGRYETTFTSFKKLLKQGGFSKDYVDNFKIILWDIPNGYYQPKGTKTFESLANCPNCYHIGGFDPAGITFITGQTMRTDGTVRDAKNMEEVLETARDQELINSLTVVEERKFTRKPVNKKPTTKATSTRNKSRRAK